MSELERSEAQRLVGLLISWEHDFSTTDEDSEMANQAADELLRLEAECEALRTALAESDRKGFEVTPQMLRDAQWKSDLGTHVCSSMSGAYTLLTDLYQVMYVARNKA